MSSPISIKIKLLNPHVMPKKAFTTDAGWDIFATCSQILAPGECAAIPVGISVAIPPGYCIVLKERSGLALKNSLRIGGGVIDSSYRGEIKAIVHNLSPNMFQITEGMKIAQKLVLPVPEVTFVPVDNLDETARGDGGFGSSGL